MHNKNYFQINILRLLFVVFLSLTFWVPPIFAQTATQVNLPEGAIARLGKGKITKLQFLENGNLLAVGSDIGVWIYEVNTGDVKHLLTPHPGGVDNFAISPDQNTLASSGCQSSKVILWDLPTGTRKLTLSGEVNIVGNALTFSKDGKTLIGLFTSQAADNTLKRWDIATTRVLSKDSSTGLGAPLSCYADKNTFAGVSREGKINLLLPEVRNPGVLLGRKTGNFLSKFSRSGDIRNRLARHSMMRMTFSADGKTIATGDEKGIIRLWEAKTRTARATLKAETGWITALAFNKDNTLLASGNAGKHIHLWNAHTGDKHSTLNGHTHTITALAFAPDGKILASGSLDGTIRFWDVKTAKALSIFASDHVMGSRSVAFTPDNTKIVTSTFNGKVQTWDVNTGDKTKTFAAAPIAHTLAMTISPDASRFAVYGTLYASIATSGNGNSIGRHSMQGTDIIRFWDLNTDTELPQLKRKFGGSALLYSSDNKLLIIAKHFGDSVVWDTTSATELFSFKTQDMIFAFSSDSNYLATDGSYRETFIWDVENQKLHSKLTAEDVETLAFSPDNSIIAIGSRREIHLWNLNTGKQPSTILTEHVIKLDYNQEVSALTFSPDGKTLIGGVEEDKSEQGRFGWQSETIYGLKLWDVQTAKIGPTYSGHSDKVEKLQFSHDGKILASTSNDGTVLLWNWEKIAKKFAPVSEYYKKTEKK